MFGIATTLLCLLIATMAVGDCSQYYNTTIAYSDACVDCMSAEDEGENGCAWTVFGCVEGPCDEEKEEPYGCRWTSCRRYGEGVGDCNPDWFDDLWDTCQRNGNEWCASRTTCKDCLSYHGCRWEHDDGDESCVDVEVCNFNRVNSDDPDNYWCLETCGDGNEAFDGFVIMNAGDEIFSGCDCKRSWKFLDDGFYIKQRKRGNLVIRRGEPGNSRIVWESGVDKQRTKYWSRLQHDCNLVTRKGTDKSGPTAWKSRTTEKPGHQDCFLGVTKDLKAIEIWKGTPNKPGKLLKTYKSKLA